MREHHHCSCVKELKERIKGLEEIKHAARSVWVYWVNKATNLAVFMKSLRKAIDQDDKKQE